MGLLKKFPYLLILVAFSGCSEDDFCNCLKRTGPAATEARNVPAFSKIEMNNNIDVELVQDTVDKVFITCGENLLDGISTEVEGSTLILKNNNKCNWMRDLGNKFTARIHVRNLDYILNQGTGDIKCLDSLRYSPFLLECSNGTGEYKLLFSTTNVELKLHSGPADLFVEGLINNIYIYSAGNGYVHASSMKANYCTVSTSGTGDISVNAAVRLDATIDYIADVFYTGTPEIKRYGNGSGQIKPL